MSTPALDALGIEVDDEDAPIDPLAGDGLFMDSVEVCEVHH
jgi:hypothetical protein